MAGSAQKKNRSRIGKKDGKKDDKTRTTRCLFITRKYVRFQWEDNLYEYLFLCFVPGPAPRIFTKLLKIPIALLLRTNIMPLMYFDDMMMMGKTLVEILMNRDTIIFLLQHLGLVINIGKSQLEPSIEMEFLNVK